MYALMREGKNPMMVAAREAIYGCLRRESRQVGTKLICSVLVPSRVDDSDLYDILGQMWESRHATR